MRFSVGCRLRYQLFGPGTLIFNVHALNRDNQQVREEEFFATPDAVCDEWTEPATQNRFVRVNAPAGDLQIDYRAQIESWPSESPAEQISEIPASQLPLDVLPFLYPSRYCQSDRLLKLAADDPTTW